MIVKSPEEKVKERYLKNFFFLKENAPNMLEKIQREGNLDWRIIVGENGSLNALIKNEYLYPYDPKELARDQVNNLMQDPKRIVNPIFGTPSEKQFIHFKYYSELIKLNEDRTISSFIYDGKNIPAIIVFGMGFGYHIVELIRRFNIQHMIVIEVNPDLFKLSLYAIDWSEVFSYFKKEGRSFNVIIEDDFEKLKHHLNQRLAFINPAFMSYLFFFEHFSSPVFDKLKDWLIVELTESPLMWGFFDDEVWSLKHTIGNIKNGIPVFYGDKKVETDIPVFIVGSGPSLDKSINVIKKFSKNAIIVSCGTALGALYRAGIKPDVHIEIERTEIVYKTLLEIDRKFLKDIPIVGMNTVYPKVFKLGKRGYMFLKPNDTGSTLFPIELPRIYNSNPTVTAGAVSLMANAGFKNFYLFGVDLGAKDPKEHHSKLSGYFNEKSMLKGTGIHFDREIEGNFGGKVLSNMVFFFTKKAIEESIRLFNLKVFNTSDGAKVEGALPLSLKEIDIQSVEDKEKAIKKFFTNFKSSYKSQINLDKFKKGIVEDMNLYLREFMPRLTIPSPDLGAVIQLVSDMHFYLLALGLRKKTKGEYVLRNLLGPSLYLFHRILMTRAFTTKDEKERKEYLTKAYSIVGNFLREAEFELIKALELKI